MPLPSGVFYHLKEHMFRQLINGMSILYSSSTQPPPPTLLEILLKYPILPLSSHLNFLNFSCYMNKSMDLSKSQ